MTKLRFPDATTERRALGFLAGRFSFKSLDTGETFVPESALPTLALEGISFTGVGRASQSILTLRNPVAATVQ